MRSPVRVLRVEMDMDTVVIGGGITGLSLAYLLRTQGRQVQLLEASPRLGGNIHTRVRDGFVVESGPSSFLDREPALRRLVSGLGLEGRLRQASPAARRRFVYTRGRLRALPSSPREFLGSDVLPLGARLRVLAELFHGREATQGDESLASFARRHFGETVTRVLVDAMQGGIYAGDMEALSAEGAFPKLVALARANGSVLRGAMRNRPRRAGEGGDAPTGALSSFEGGLQTLVDALGAALGPSAVTDSPVEELVPGHDGWKVVVRRGGERTSLLAGRVVVATPARAAAGLLRGLSPAASELLGGIPYARMAVVHLGFAPGTVPPPEGFGFLVPSSAGRRLLGVVHASSVFPWRAPGGGVLYTCMLGGAHHPEVADIEDAALVQLAREELAQLAKVHAEPSFSDVVRWQRAVPQYTVGHAARLAVLEAEVARFPGLHLAGSAYRGAGLTDCVRNAEVLAGRLSGGPPASQ